MQTRPKLVVLSGAGISAESGIKTFRDNDGLWENHRVEDVATIEAWHRDPVLVQTFYNQRRKQLPAVKPNAGHYALARLEEKYDVTIITQNVDDLHERAGSTNVMHLHGELLKVRSSKDPDLILETYDWETNNYEIPMGALCAKGSQLRPHIVWFGEAVPMIEPAIEQVLEAELFIVTGTSLAVYPAAGLVDFVDSSVPIYVVDPNIPEVRRRDNVTLIPEPASTGLTKLVNQLLSS
jgi:NAD-dependent deacetylase